MFELIDEWGPEKVVCVSDARTGMRGVLVIDNTARGMGKGGTRMSTTVTVGEVARLARNMTWKWAGVDLFFGVPDFIANAGGVVAAAVAMDARYSGIQPEPAAVFDNISNKLRASTIETLVASQTQGRTTHEVARAIAQQRVREAMELRGRVPRAAAVHIPTESRR